MRSAFIILIMISCQVAQDSAKSDYPSGLKAESDLTEDLAGKTKSPGQSDWQTAHYPARLWAWNGAQRSRISIADIAVPDCATGTGPTYLRVKMNTVFGSRLLRIALSEPPIATGPPSPISFPAKLKAKSKAKGKVPPAAPSEELSGDLIEVDVDGRQFRFRGQASLRSNWRAKACLPPLPGAAQSEIEADGPSLSHIRSWLARIAPDCALIEPSNDGFECRLPVADPELAAQELSGIRTTMVRRWSRQPYLLTRRLAVGSKLAELLQASDWDARLNTLCDIIKRSLPLELPVVLTSERWREAACNPQLNPLQKRTVAQFGLAKALVEVDFLRQLFEQTSKLGSLSVKLPPTDITMQQVWVSLTPESDVTENLAKAAARLWSDSGGREELPRACWHPVFGESTRLMLTARHLTLTGDGGLLDCGLPLAATTDPEGPARYVADSITSDTEVMVSNHRGITLRLPVGSYRYDLRGLPADPSEWDDAAHSEPLSTGRIVWHERKPRPVINKW